MALHEGDLIIQFQLDSATSSADQLDDLRLNLREEIIATNVGNATLPRPSDPVAAGAKGDPVTVGGLVILLSVTALPGLVALVQAWLLRQKDQTLRARIGEVEIEIPRDASDDEVNRIVQAVLAAQNA